MTEAGIPTCPGADLPASVEDAILTRRSVRAFLPRFVPVALVSHLIAVASRAPSGGNIQPWKVHVVMGPAKARLEADLLATFCDPDQEPEPEYDYYPQKWSQPYLARRRALGRSLYDLLGIERRDVPAMRSHQAENFRFFGAPVGLFFSLARTLSQGSWLDAGMFIQTFMIAARGAGLHTCPQAAFTSYHRVVRRHVRIPDEDILLCGMALGYEDPTRRENALRTAREPVEGFTVFYDI